jgi:hypothetical protein
MEPLVGAAAEYSSNPFLLSSDQRSASDVALAVSDPTHYDLDNVHFTISPSIRYSSGGSYASLASNYFHLNGSSQWTTELDSVSATAGLGRDSSLLQSGLSSNGLGVRTDSISGGLSWQRKLTPRSVFSVSGNWSRVFYSQNASATGLIDYRYTSFAISESYALTERTKLQVFASGGKYRAHDDLSGSKNYSLQMGLDRQLTAVWDLSLVAGFARSDNSHNSFAGPFRRDGMVVGPFFVGTVKSEQKGPVYSGSLVRSGEQSTLSATLSRSFLPSGFNFLSREDIGAIDMSYTMSERWAFDGKVSYQSTVTPALEGQSNAVRYVSSQLSANWHWTADWVVSLHGNWASVKYQLPPLSAQSTGVSVQISRQFLRIEL